MYTNDGLLYGLEKCLQGEDIVFNTRIEDLGTRGLDTWRLVHKISEKTSRKDYHLFPYEAVTVYTCEKVDGGDAGQRATMKIRVEYVRLRERKHGVSYLLIFLGY
jgi:hypothetical protein